MLYIEIVEESLDLIRSLNDGVAPEIEDETTYFVYEPNRQNITISAETFEKIIAASTKVTIVPVVIFD